MTENKVLADTILSASTETATIHAPLEAIDIADWLRNLPDREYQRCAPPDQRWPATPPPTMGGRCRSTSR
jgi:hypothetical protein